MSGFSMYEYKKFLDGKKPTMFCSWVNIVVFLICILPLGLIAYWKRAKIDKSTYLHTWKLVLVFGIIVFLFGVRVFASTGSAIINVLIGVLLILIALFMRKRAFLRMDILGMLLVQREFNVRKIALAIHKDERIVHNEILEMIKKGMLPGVVVDYDTNEVFVPGYTGGTIAEYMERTAGENDVSPIEKEIEIDDEKNKKKNLSPMETGICSCCGVELTKEAIENKKCQLCGRIFDADYGDDEDEDDE